LFELDIGLEIGLTLGLRLGGLGLWTGTGLVLELSLKLRF
jgi:hypothetical protein